MDNVKTNSVKAWILAARPKTLAGAAVPVIVGLALAYAYVGVEFKIFPAIFCLLFAFVMQIDANFINDYFDFKKGTDRDDRLGPERACAQGWITPQAMKWGLVVTTAIAVAIGLPLVCYGGWALIIVGLLCVLFAFLYTAGKYPLSYYGFGDVLVFVFFGIVPVGFTFYVQLNAWPLPVTLCGAACGLVIDTLLMVNNYRDRETDARSGKHTIVVRFGEAAGRWAYFLLGVCGVAICLALFAYGFTFAALFPLLYLIPHYFSWQKLTKINRGKELNLILGETARNIFIFGLLLAVGLIIR